MNVLRTFIIPYSGWSANNFMSTPIANALALELNRLRTPVILMHDVARAAWALYKKKEHEGRQLHVQRSSLDRPAFMRVVRALQYAGTLQPVAGFSPESVASLIGRDTNDRNAMVCTLDPFCFLSHLSAMEFHGLTDRFPEVLYVSSPGRKEWGEQAQARMQKDLGQDWEAFKDTGLPLLRRIEITRINRKPVHRYSSSHLGAFRAIKDSPVRVATLGRTFLDMLRVPDLCGSMQHVIAVYRQHAEGYRRLILDELEQHGSAIEKARAGFLFEEVCKITDPRLDLWAAQVIRGGSRKLDASAEYAPEFSQRWALSINVALGEDA